MKLLRLNIKNFCNIKNLSLEFPHTGLVNLITGDNGSGKSSILKAVAYAMLRSTEGNTEEYIRQGESSFSIQLFFEHKNCSYEMSVLYSKKGKTGTSSRQLTFVEGEEVRTLAGADALAHMEAILGSSSASYSIFAAQGDLDFIYATPAVRRQLLQNLYDLSFKEEIEYVTQQLNDARQRVVVIEKDIAHKTGVLEGLKLVSVPELPFTEEEYKWCVESKGNIEQQIEFAKEQITKHNQLLEQMTKLTDEVDRLNSERNRFYRNNPKGKTVEDLMGEMEPLIEEKKASIAEYKEAKQVLPRPKKEPVFEKEEKAQIEAAWSVVLQEKLFKARMHHKELTSMEKTCSLCGAPREPVDPSVLEEAAKTLADLESQRSEATARINALDTIIKQYEEHQKTTMIMMAHNTKIDRSLELCEAQIATIRYDYQKKSAELATVENERAELQLALDLAAKAVEPVHEEVKKIAVENWKGKLGVMTTQLGEYNTSINLYDGILSKIDIIEKQNAETEKDRRDVQALINILSMELEQLSAEALDWDEVRSALKTSLPSYVLTNLTKNLELATNKFMWTAYQGRYAIKLQENDRSGIELLYGTDEVWRPASGASGAERSLINLGLKIGLSKLSGLNLLILDEVDAYLSTSNAKTLFEILKNQLQLGMLDQIYVITHDEAVKETLGTNGRVIHMVDGALAEE